MNRFSLFADLLYSSVANLANPSLYMKQCTSGITWVTNTYILKSNFFLSIKYGNYLYCWTTWQTSLGISFIFFVKNIPLPWLEFIGFTINVTYFFLSCKKFIMSYDSAGYIQVFGKNWNSVGIYFYISFKYLAKLFFIEIIVMPGKWLIL